MAWKADVKYIPGQTAAGDISSDQFKFGKISSTGVVRATVQGEYIDGVISNDDADAAGKVAQVAYQGIAKTKAAAAIAKGARVMTNAAGLAMTAVSAPTAATKACGAETYDFAPGDTAVIDVDNAGNATSTWDAAQGYEIDDTTYAVGSQIGLTISITVDSGTAQIITFVGAITTAAEIIDEINAQVVGASAVASTTHVKVLSDTYGTDSTVVLTAGTSDMTFGNAAVDGTGDVADINAVTAAEIETVIEADTTATVAVVAGVPTISSPTTGATSELDFISGNALALLGLSVETLNGAASGTYSAGKAMEAASAAGDIIPVLLETVKN